jgi:predicted nucleic-acid-binding protein
MTGLDTNVLVRLLTADDAAQTAKVRKLLAAHEGEADAFFINNIVLVETFWVLRRGYKLAASDVLTALTTLADCTAYAFENRELLRQALALSQREGADFADALILLVNQRAGCQQTATFDKGMPSALALRL